MNAIFSIHKKFSDFILSGYKDLEFRNKSIKLNKGDKVYLYETKATGVGKIVGYFVVEKVEEITHYKLGAYNFIAHYTKKFWNERDYQKILKALKIDLEHYDNSMILNYLFLDKLLLFCSKFHKPPKFEQRYLYEETHKDLCKKRDKLIDETDNWLDDIGYYNDFGEAYWKYCIYISNYKRFDVPMNIQDFTNTNNNPITRAPQSFCYTNSNY